MEYIGESMHVDIGEKGLTKYDNLTSAQLHTVQQLQNDKDVDSKIWVAN